MKDWYIYGQHGIVKVADNLEEVYAVFKEVNGADDADLDQSWFGIIKIQSESEPKLQHIKVARTLKLI